jgi:hypothetical protein
MRCVSKKGQLTIFIVAGILIVGTIVFYFIFKQGLLPDIGGGKEINANAFLEACIEEKIQEADEILSLQGGDINNPSFYIPLEFIEEKVKRNISYLCYTNNYYVPCVNRQPLLMNHLEEEIESYINEEVRLCFDNLESSLKKQNYEVKKTYLGFNVELIPSKILVDIEGDMTLTRAEKTFKEKNFNIIVKSRLYDLATIAKEIVSGETEFCYFDANGFMLLYPEYKIDILRKKYTLIYTILEKNSLKKFRFAVRGCATRSGL